MPGRPPACRRLCDRRRRWSKRQPAFSITRPLAGFFFRVAAGQPGAAHLVEPEVPHGGQRLGGVALPPEGTAQAVARLPHPGGKNPAPARARLPGFAPRPKQSRWCPEARRPRGGGCPSCSNRDWNKDTPQAASIWKVSRLFLWAGQRMNRATASSPAQFPKHFLRVRRAQRRKREAGREQGNGAQMAHGKALPSVRDFLHIVAAKSLVKSPVGALKKLRAQSRFYEQDVKTGKRCPKGETPMPCVYILLTRTDTLFARLLHGVGGSRYTPCQPGAGPGVSGGCTVLPGATSPSCCPGGFIRRNIHAGVFGRCGGADSLLLELEVSHAAYEAIERQMTVMASAGSCWDYDVLGLALAYTYIYSCGRANTFAASSWRTCWSAPGRLPCPATPASSARRTLPACRGSGGLPGPLAWADRRRALPAAA